MAHGGEQLQRGDDAVAGGLVVEEDEVAGCFTADHGTFLLHHLEHVAVADFAGARFDADFFERGEKAEVTHDGGDEQVVFEEAEFLVVLAADGHDVVAGDFLAVFIDGNHAVAIAIEGEADVGFQFAHLGTEVLRVLRAAVVVDVHAVGFAMDGSDVGAEFAEDDGGGLVGGAVRAIEHDLRAFEGHRFREGVFAEHDVAAHGVVDAVRLADFTGGGADVFHAPAGDEIFDFVLFGVGEFEAIAGEDLDAVVLIGIVGGGDHHAGIGAHAARDEGDAGRAHRADEVDVDAHRADAGGEGGFEHVAAYAGILTDHDRVTPVRMFFADVRGGAANLKGQLRGHGVHVRDAANTVGSKESFHSAMKISV